MFFTSPGVRDDRLSLREAKQQVQREIERQRAIIEDYDRSADRNRGSLAASGEDLRWYQDQTNVLAKLNEELYLLRLRGAEFNVRSKANVSFVMEVARSGRITLFEQHEYRERNKSVDNDVDDIAARLASTSSSLRKPVDIFYIDSLLKVRPLETTIVSFGGLQAGSADKLVRLDFKQGSLSLAVSEPDELLQVLGSFLSQYNHNKVRQIRRLIELNELKTVPFNRFSRHHEMLLQRLWSALLPSEPLEPRISEKWKLIGFQSKDPVADLRGMGMLGLHNLVYFAEVYTSRCQEIAFGSRPFPFAVVGINITQMCCTLLNLSEDQMKLAPSDPKWDSSSLTFFAYVQHEHAFEELFCFAVDLLDITFVKVKAEYMDFPAIYDRVLDQIKDIMDRKPLSFEELRAFFDWSAGSLAM